MLAGQFTERRRIDLVETDEPCLPNAAELSGQIIFQPELTCLCGSDLPFFDGDFEGHPVEYPQPIGMSLHEMIGTVVDTNGSRWKPGSRVLAVPVMQHGFFERFLLDETRAIQLDDRISDDIALMAQPFGTVIWAMKKMPNMIDRDVVILGLGPIGQMFVAVLCNLGARHVIGIDPHEHRVEVATKMGATEVICALGRNSENQVRSLLGGALPDVVIEAVGHRAQAFYDATLLCREHGHILYFGIPPVPTPCIDLRMAMLKNQRIITSCQPDFDRTFPLAMQWLAEGRVDLTSLLTHRFPLSEIQKAFDIFRDRGDGVLKVLVDFPAGNHV